MEEARSLAKSLNPKDRTEIEKLCDEIDKLKNELANEVNCNDFKNVVGASFCVNWCIM